MINEFFSFIIVAYLVNLVLIFTFRDSKILHSYQVFWCYLFCSPKFTNLKCAIKNRLYHLILKRMKYFEALSDFEFRATKMLSKKI